MHIDVPKKTINGKKPRASNFLCNKKKLLLKLVLEKNILENGRSNALSRKENACLLHTTEMFNSATTGHVIQLLCCVMVI